MTSSWFYLYAECSYACSSVYNDTVIILFHRLSWLLRYVVDEADAFLVSTIRVIMASW